MSKKKPQSQTNYYHFSVEKTCGMRTRENCTYFVNEGFPKPTTAAPKICALTVDKADPAVQQLRIEFQTFEVGCFSFFLIKPEKNKNI